MGNYLEKELQDYNWVLKIVKNAETQFQCDSCDKLLEAFQKRYPHLIALKEELDEEIVYQRKLIFDNDEKDNL